MALEREERRERGNALEDGQGVLDAFGSERLSSSCALCKIRLHGDKLPGVSRSRTRGRTPCAHTALRFARRIV